jgi:succinate-semialdehyde dehydrogenase / glutarate-semialdehyde dehydrogenase
MRYETIDPATGLLSGSYPTATADEVESALVAAAAASERARRRDATERAPLLRALADLFEDEAPRLARTAAEEMGKPLAQGEAEAKKCATGCRWVADAGPALLAPERRTSDGREAWVRYDPLGPLLALMPWNFPFWQVVRFAAPALLAGNTVLLKHASSVPECALALERLFREAGFEPGAFTSLFLDPEQAGRVIDDARIRGVSLTGSTRAGRVVAARAGAALKPCVLELGGSDPFVVFADAPLETTVAAAVQARCQNAGQSCIAAKRFFVERPLLARFRDAFAVGLAALRVGPPKEPATQVGPLAREDLRTTLAEQVAASVALGARVLVGGRVPPGPGAYYPPTLLVDVPPEAPAAREELFGPVAVLEGFEGEEQAVALANQTPYGLGASLWTADLARARRLVPRIEAGSVFVNGIVKSDPRLPFGGAKDSGLGRELGVEGLRAFTNAKTVWIA